ncbi:uncharacterized protein LOC111025603 [Momordica charantia]|uniref:Uncharacterized protein LOC111025603 n=1 Tax=Momordica charantia TaxID=3673 RepID=A0A6J1DY41_MOMCH|nr:uncharacterized protein LOC111025603 [Momordica charantia]
MVSTNAWCATCQASWSREMARTDDEVGLSMKDIAIGSTFRSKEELQFKLSVFAMRVNFEYHVKKSTKSLYPIGCSEDGCKWSPHVRKIQGSDIFLISTFYEVHSCIREVMKHDHRQAQSRVVGQIIKSNFEDVSCRYRPKDIVNDMQKNYYVNIRYALMGSPKKSYTLLRKYVEALKSVNSGMVFPLKLEHDKYFQYALMALGCSIRGFRSCICVVLVIDDAHLKEKYKGVILKISFVDGNNHICPLALGIVDRETDNPWTWFL